MKKILFSTKKIAAIVLALSMLLANMAIFTASAPEYAPTYYTCCSSLCVVKSQLEPVEDTLYRFLNGLILSSLYFEIEIGGKPAFVSPLLNANEDYRTFTLDACSLQRIQLMANSAYTAREYGLEAVAFALTDVMPELGRLHSSYLNNFSPQGLLQRLDAAINSYDIFQPFQGNCCDPFIIIREYVLWGYDPWGRPFAIWRYICASCRRAIG
ncbi:MAG: hypothetical protein FWC78_06525 [Defluviitaleaceae bacterium]|nr:hypothetical protein [Defluviitaleaceae bacterium]